jgi:hypothetical protein
VLPFPVNQGSSGLEEGGIEETLPIMHFWNLEMVKLIRHLCLPLILPAGSGEQLVSNPILQTVKWRSIEVE